MDSRDELRNKLKGISFVDTKAEEQTNQRDIQRDIRNRIVFFRKRANLSQKQLAEISGITQANISRFERGLSVPSVESLKKIADALEVDLVIDFVERV